MSEQQVLPEDVAKAGSHVVNDGTIAGYLMYPEYHSLQRQLAQSEAERERLQESYEQSTYFLGMKVIETATLRAELAREGEANQWHDVNQEMPTERERVLCKFEDHPAEVSWWFKWPEMDKALWHPGLRGWGRVTHWKQIEPPALLEPKSTRSHN